MLDHRSAFEDPLDKTTGHHHIIIDGKPVAAGTAVPADETHIHYGKGQTEAKIKLSEGEHTLSMQLADGAHLSYGPKLSTSIKVKVVKSAGERKVFFDGLEDGAKVKIKAMVEKPAADEAPSNLAVIGRYILTPDVMDNLNRMKSGAGGEIR